MPSDDQSDAGGARTGPDHPADELADLDPDDPEAQAFAAHLARMQAVTPAFTVEGTVERLGDFAESGTRTRGTIRVVAVILAALVLIWVLMGGFASLMSSVFG